MRSFTNVLICFNNRNKEKMFEQNIEGLSTGCINYNKLNCTWMLKADQGSYVNFEIDYFQVKSDTIQLVLA